MRALSGRPPYCCMSLRGTVTLLAVPRVSDSNAHTMYACIRPGCTYIMDIRDNFYIEHVSFPLRLDLIQIRDPGAFEVCPSIRAGDELYTCSGSLFVASLTNLVCAQVTLLIASPASCTSVLQHRPSRANKLRCENSLAVCFRKLSMPL